MAERSTARVAVVHASADDIVTALTEFERFPEWQRIVTECEVLERDPQGRGTVVRMKVDATVRSVEFVVRYEYDLPRALGWQLVSGDLRVNTGRYEFESRADGVTVVRVDIHAEPAFFVPGPVKRLIRDQAIRTALRELTKRVERTSGGRAAG